MKVLHAIGGQRVLVVGTCNRLENISDELRRRFRLGIYYTPLPGAESKRTIWEMN